jgi:hypothetical protein
MQRPFLITVLAMLTCALVLPPVAAAGPVKGPPSFHERFVWDSVHEDFCGTGVDVSLHVESHATVWERDDAFKIVLNEKAWRTYNDVTLLDQVSGRTIEIAAPPLTGAAATREVIETGLRAKLKLANGKVLTADHGLLHYRVNFDANGDFLGIELLRERGGHPAFQTVVWCQAATAAFGIPFEA